MNECSRFAVSPVVDHALDCSHASLGRHDDEERLGEEPALPRECPVTDSSHLKRLRLLHQIAFQLFVIRLGGDEGVLFRVLDLANHVGNRCLDLDLI